MRALVTGGGGFLGSAIVRLLLDRGLEVRTVQRGSYPALEALGVEVVKGDIADAETMLKAAADCEILFHVAAKAGVWGSYESYHAPNVTGTENVLEAARGHKIGKVIFTSSPSVTFSGRDQINTDENDIYPDKYLSFYPQTKARAERLVLEANSPELATIALRPHLIWGPGDNHLVPRILDRGRAGRLRIVGSGEQLVDTTYIDNAAQAHLDAMDRLEPGAPCAGKAYYISNDEPIPIKTIINRFLVAGGLRPVDKHIGAGTAYAAGALLEGMYTILRKREEPPMTRFVARQLATAHWYNLAAAKRDLGYRPSVSIEEGLARLESYLRQAS